MFKVLKFSIIFFFLLNFTTSYSSENIRFINLDLVIQNTISGKQLLNTIELSQKANLKKFKIEENNLREMEQQIINQKNILSKEEFEKRLLNLKKEMNNYNNKKKKIILDFENDKKNKIENYFKTISPYIQDFVKKNSIGIVINKQNIFIASKDFDITNDIIKVIDSNLK